MEHGEIKEAGGGGMTTSSSSAAARKGSSGSHEVLKCPRCDSLNTKFCYYNNYNLSQPRHFCKNCRRYWTKGGSLRSVPVGGGCRKNKRSRHGSSGPNTGSAIRSNLTSSINLLDVGHLSGSGGHSTSAFLHSVPPHLLQLHDYASASSAAAAANHNNFGLTFSRLQESMRSSPSASLMMPAHSYEPLNLNPHLNLDQTSLVNHLGIYNNNNSNTLNTTSCTNTTNTNTNHNNHNPPPATDLSLLIDDHHRPFTANTTSTVPAAAHEEWSKLHAEHHPHKLGLTSNCMQLMQMNDQDHDHGHHGFGHIIPPPSFPDEEKPPTGQSNSMDHQQHQWFQGGVQQMESGILQEGWAWPDFFSLAGSAAGTIP